MLWIVFSCILLVLAAIGVGYGLYLKRQPFQADDYRSENTRRLGGRVVVGSVITFVVLFGALTAIKSYTVTPAGKVNVVYSFGSIDGQLEEGQTWIAPWKSVKEANVQVQKQTFEDVAAVSEETQNVRARVTINYSIDPNDVQDLFRNVGTDWFDRLVPNRVQQAFKETTVLYKTVDIAPNREKIKQQTQQKLQTSLARYSITINDVNIENLAFDEAFTKAIEQKQVATQEALRQQQLVAAKKAEADQKIAEARGQAEANRLLSASLREDPRLLELRIAETQANAIIALAKEGTVQMIPSEILLQKPVTP
jgi:regulator of protease activity HflC (stomatin/prohibitin superfamily)